VTPFSSSTRYAGMRVGWLAIVAVGIVVAACGQAPTHPTANLASPAPSPSSISSPVATPSPSATPSAAPTAVPSPAPVDCAVPQPLQDVCVGRAPTSSEAQAILTAGRSGVEAKYGLKPIATCHNGDRCFALRNPPLVMVGTEAAVFDGLIGLYPAGGLGCSALVFLSHDSAGWHYVNSGCVQNSGFMPGADAHVYVSAGCANVRTRPALTGIVLACLKANTAVSVDSAPVYADGHIWWHLAGRGWMAHDFLVAPNI
jgi:hypothetical protein